MAVTIDDIRAAAQRISGALERTPCVHSRTLSRLAGAEVFLKFENLQFTASFKERGALNKLLSLSPAERRRGVIAMSAGNHAQALAYHAARLAIPAVIVMPRGSPNTKIRNTRVHGAEVVLEGDSLADAARHAAERAAREHLVFVHPYEDPLVIAGQGSVGLEMLEAVPDLDCLVVPIGGGGLIAGTAIAAHARRPGIEVLGRCRHRCRFGFVESSLDPLQNPTPGLRVQLVQQLERLLHDGQLGQRHQISYLIRWSTLVIYPQ